MAVELGVPKFRECSGDKKYVDLTETDYGNSCNDVLYQNLLTQAERHHIASQGAKVLDFGCGRGQFVGYLRQHGLRAYGIEVDAKLIQAGQVLSASFQDELPLLSLVSGEGHLPFPDGYFDMIVANQVFEHVSHLEEVAAEIGRLLRPGGILLTLYPARFTLVEPHYHLSVVHWLPKGKLQRALIHLLVRAGFGVPPPSGVSRQLMGDIISEYADHETFYRSNHVIADICAHHGLRLDFDEIPQDMLDKKLKRLSGVRRLVFSATAGTLPLVTMRNLFKSCAAVGVKEPRLH
ncbi:methyltransferase domain-containing protein [Duganella sp. CY15W]|uniref:class I SAM-dependent methyltransferase n=1 Tax=Duganella sp. CY15W TaxID=2692172 RepID=UPI00136E1B66|nr:class I SAM-dependent methyltransferase [Duganella sp. CY15W]MYM32549.1 methyltransferase domain-containing protein [Duganella sp. CY15W]